MFRIAKSEEIKDYKIDLELNNVSKFIDGKVVKTDIKYLTVIIESKEYSMDFTIEKDIKEILNIKKHEEIVIPFKNLSETFLTTKGKTDFMEIKEMKIHMMASCIAITFTFRNHHDYYGDIDIEIKLDDIKKLTTEK